ncbi:hypothetical protein MS3_00002537 [Schistosoma haematobium]|uniref:Uncharacterized protein n=1 Tax=Schistosoma haematobium TaxID=6185 RepID=A0A094ZPX8_SCHHA|nr:hypothetical protein MS3_00002537 [Schistosoma haematobium]KAH9589480.1 hypothetical protein MS3_00002537 [Schistosoma haematobium]
MIVCIQSTQNTKSQENNLHNTILTLFINHFCTRSRYTREGKKKTFFQCMTYFTDIGTPIDYQSKRWTDFKRAVRWSEYPSSFSPEVKRHYLYEQRPYYNDILV